MRIQHPSPWTAALWLLKGSGIQVPVLSQSSGSVGDRELWSKFSPLHVFQLHALWFCSVVPEKRLSILSNPA